MTVQSYIYPNPTKENPHVIADYPWGFKLRTEKRVWIDTNKAGDQRVVSQTKDPKTGRWCAPKAGTYSQVVFLYLDENSHVQSEGLGYHSSETDVRAFAERHQGQLDPVQVKQINKLLRFHRSQQFYKVEIVGSDAPRQTTEERNRVLASAYAKADASLTRKGEYLKPGE